MSGSVNKMLIVGYVGADPEISYTPGGRMRASFSVATNWRKLDGSWETTWHHLVMLDELAEQAEAEVRKGKQVYAEGRIHVTLNHRTEVYVKELLVSP